MRVMLILMWKGQMLWLSIFAEVSSIDNCSEEFREHKKRFAKGHGHVFRVRCNTKSVLNVDV